MKIALIIILYIFLCFEAEASFLIHNNVDYCEGESPRHTIIYVDETSVGRLEQNWAKQILNKISFLPHERISVLSMKAGTASVHQAMNLACYPGYTVNELNLIESQRGLKEKLFSTSIDEQLGKDKHKFDSMLRSALGYPLTVATQDHLPKYSKIPGKKEILETLYYDEQRFNLKYGYPRVIIYSDMLQNSKAADLVSMEYEEAAVKASNDYDVNFNRAEIYVFGVSTTYNDTSYNNKLFKFWESWFLKNDANLHSFSSNLSIEKQLVENLSSWRGHLTQSDGRTVSAQARFVSDKNGNLISGWFSLNNYGAMPLKGTIVCHDGQSCRLLAEIEKAQGIFKAGDVLEGIVSESAFKGVIRAPDSTHVVPGANGKLNSFSFPIEMKMSTLFDH